MVLPFLVDNNELLMWERCSFLVFLTVSFNFAKYQQIIVLVAVATFLIIYSLYLYNFVRDFLETDCEKLEATIDGVEKIYLSSNGQKIAFIDHLYKRLWNEQSKRRKLEYEKVLDFKEKCVKLEEEKGHLVYELEERQKKVMKLEEQCVKLVEEKRGLEKEIGDLDDELSWERLKLSDLEVYHMTLEEETEKLGKELEEERKAKQSFNVSSERISELVAEMLNGRLLEIVRSNNEQVKKVEEQNKKLGKKKRELKKKCNKLEEEKKVWVAERENLLLAVVDSKASLVQTYKDVFDKEECLMKLFDVKASSSGLA